MLQYSFEVLKINRVGFSINARNLRSHQALLKLGAVEEGTLRKHRVIQDGYVCDALVFSILADEWSRLKQKFKFV